MSKYLSRAEILGKVDRIYQDVKCPEWGTKANPIGLTRVQSLTGLERDEWEELCQVEKAGKKEFSTKQLREKLLAKTCVDGDGKLLFSEGDLIELAKKNSTPLTRLFDVARKLSGIGVQDVEELTKNSEAAPGGDSSST